MQYYVKYVFYSLQETSVVEDLPVHCSDSGSHNTKNNYLWQSQT